jgi:hypothetical protein
VYSNVRDSKPLPGSGGCLCLILFSRTSLSISGVLPIADPPGRQFFFHSGLWAKGRELLRMELQRRKSAATDLFCSSSSSLPPSTSPTFTVFDFPMLFYSGSSLFARYACTWSRFTRAFFAVYSFLLTCSSRYQK